MSLKHLSYTLAGVLLCAAAVTPGIAQNGTRPSTGAQLVNAQQPVPGEYIVVLKEQAARLAHEQRSSLPSTAQVAESMARAYGLNTQHTYTHVLRGFAARANDKALVKLLLDDRVAYVEENGVVSISQTTQPNATWGLDRVDQRDLPLSGNYVYDTTASNVRAYIIDTGVLASHNDFGGRVLSGYTAINDGRGSNDCNGHGTHVAGTVAGATWGVAKAARIVPVRVLGCDGSGSNAGVVAGMDWVAANHSKPAVANMSLGGGASTTTDNAVANMRNAGVTVVVAAGNENQNACNVSPARSSAAITVGSTTSSDARSSFSNWGSCVDVSAPGSSITSAWYTSNSATNTISGTSMASPHVAGGAALYLADNPSATPAQVENAIFAAASSGKLSGLNGSPNLLLYTRFDGGGGGGGGGPTELDNGVALTNLSGAQGSETFYTIDVPANGENLVIQISGGSGDADLYVRFGSAPTTASYDCRPYRNGNEETCTVETPNTGTYHVMLHAYQAYSGVSLVASYDTAGGGGGSQLENGQALTNLSGSQGSETFYTMEVPAGASDLQFAISGGSGDADLYVRFGSQPSTSSYDCRPYLGGNNETCSFATPAAGTWHVMVRGFQAYSGLALVGGYSESSGAPCSNCTQYSGSLTGTGNSQVQPDGNWYQTGAGTHRGWLEGPANADFDLELYRWNGSWVKVAESTSSNSEEFVEYNGTSGYYYWRIRSFSGSGSYDFWLQRP